MKLSGFPFISFFLISSISMISAQDIQESTLENSSLQTTDTLVHNPPQSTSLQDTVQSNVEFLGNAENINKKKIIAELKVPKMLAGTGTAFYFVGFGLEYLVAVPMSINAIVTQNVELATASSIISIAATGFQISGPIRAGIGASMSYDLSKKYGLTARKNINWGFYQAGWVFTIVGGILNVAGTIIASSGDEISPALSFAALGTGIAADAMFITSVINAASYTSNVRKSEALSSIDFQPYFSYSTKSTEIGLNLKF